jgi:Immunity protein 35
MALTMAEARQLALNYIESGSPNDREVVLLEDKTMEKLRSCLDGFFFSKRYVETADDRYELYGNGPIVVTKADGQVHQIGTAFPLDHYLRRFEST